MTCQYLIGNHRMRWTPHRKWYCMPVARLRREVLKLSTQLVFCSGAWSGTCWGVLSCTVAGSVTRCLMTRLAARRVAGFTLVEVMVALAIVAIALPALLFTLYQQVDTTGYLR